MTKTIDKIKFYTPTYRDQESAHIPDLQSYKEIYDNSVKDPEGFWSEQALRLNWIKKWGTISNCDFEKAQVNWFNGGKLNVSYNCLDHYDLMKMILRNHYWIQKPF